MDESNKWFADVYAREYDAILAFCTSLLPFCSGKVSPEDLTHDVFATLYSNKERLRSHPNIAAWLRVTARYCAWHVRSDIARETRLIRALSDAPVITPCDPYDALDGPRETILSEILDDDDIELLYAHYVDGKPLVEIAAGMNVSTAAIKMKLYRLRGKIRRKLR